MLPVTHSSFFNAYSPTLWMGMGRQKRTRPASVPEAETWSKLDEKKSKHEYAYYRIPKQKGLPAHGGDNNIWKGFVREQDQMWAFSGLRGGGGGGEHLLIQHQRQTLSMSEELRFSPAISISYSTSATASPLSFPPVSRKRENFLLISVGPVSLQTSFCWSFSFSCY